jgi:hypothetical protein
VAFVFSCQSNNTNSNFPSKIAIDSIEFRAPKETTSDIVIRDNPEILKAFENKLEQTITGRNFVPGFFNTIKTQLINGTMTPQNFVDFMRNTYQKDIKIDAVIIWKNSLQKNKNLDSITNTNK